jgi:WhiB family redox-sensing transcriptional regulator
MTGAWEEQARCRTVGAGPFFPEGNGGKFRAAAEEAKAVCAWCPVRQQCLELALELEGTTELARRAGVWGGTTPRERVAIHRQRTTTAA